MIAAGGTAGHVIPALSVAELLAAAGAEVEFAGGDRAESDLVPSAGFAFHRLDAEGLSRTSLLKASRAALRAVPAFFSAVRLIRARRPDVVMGGGGYVAGIVGAAAVVTRTPLVLTEADSHLGISNRLIARFAKKVCLAFPLEGRTASRYVVTGRPVPPAVRDRSSARARFKIPLDATCVLVTGGSLGASSINQAAVDAFADSEFEVLHLAGERDFPALTAPRDGYHLLSYIDDFGDAVEACDLAVARAGGSVFELASHGTPAVLVPYPQAAGDHQTGNARWMETAGAAVIISDSRLTADLLRETVEGILGDRTLLNQMSAASSGLARPQAAADVAAFVRAAAQGPGVKQ
ncbi:unannotated protein [freshwater metagenome]|uniref:Unannotated protein n=1 Tax=freshwater metagenome TaxID=449393 RepID=A0A6J7CWS8_9ZZZZ